MDRVGYRFHPTEVELIDYFLKNKMLGHESKVSTIAEVDVCDFEPHDLPQHCAIDSNNRSWYFFCRPIYKYSNSKRANRKTKSGYWKVTGKVRDIKTRTNKVIGSKRTLVFYEGRSPKGVKTNWVIHEYHPKSTSSGEDFVVCRLKKKHVGKTNSCIQNEGETSSNHHMTPGIDSCIANSSSPEVNLERSTKSASPTVHNGQDFASIGHFQDQIEQSPQNSPCINNFSCHPSGLVSQDNTGELASLVDTSEQEDLTALANSFLVDEIEFVGEGNEDTHLHDSRTFKII